jgi:hypothetical protein
MLDGHIDWIGQSGSKYRYWFVLYPHDDAMINAVAANYAFVKIHPNGQTDPLYFGITDDLSSRIPNHECWPEAQRLGVTHVMAHATPNALVRYTEERDLIAYWNPPMNVQHRTAG